MMGSSAKFGCDYERGKWVFMKLPYDHYHELYSTNELFDEEMLRDQNERYDAKPEGFIPP
jgi:hypothetical protein